MTDTLLIQGLLYVGILVSVGAGIYCFHRRGVRGGAPLALMFVGLGLWILSDIIQFHTPTDPAPQFGAQLRLLGPDITVVGLLLFGLAYTGRDELLRPSVYALLAIKPAITMLFALTTHLDLIVDVTASEVPTVGYVFADTPYFVAYTLYNWLFTVTALVLLAHMMVKARYGYQRQILALSFGITVPFLLNISYHAGLTPYDLTSSSFLVFGLIFAYATFRLRLMDAIPVARQTVIEEMDDMVIVLDESANIITVNSVVRAQFDIESALTGASATTLFENGQLEELQRGDRLESVPITIADETRYFDVNKSRVKDYRGNLIAEVLVCRDITEKKRKEEELRHREQDLELLKDLQSRFLRHNLRNELNVVRLHAQHMKEDGDPDDEAIYAEILAKTGELIEWSDKARRIEQLIEEEERTAIDADAELESIIETMADEHAAVDFRADLTAATSVEAIPQLENALENVVDNAARYNTATDPQVVISSRRVHDHVEIEVTDNGPGIDEDELAAIREGKEQPLTHGSGLGLWLLYWVMDKSDGDLQFETGDGGTTVRMRFAIATDAKQATV